ncbi:YjjW family glycine radical enzyme activase [Aeromonas media]|uniref:YjjW family glycine radical enzyme activase n=1 Tax=Aeromonas media TaxID=651 RepID=A0A7Z3CNV2_AERME|nr:YjjW family glycine radical enzyme activase [Aeromonas media]MBS4640019.1 YjjW family glycine radical enzyme activase [Aeromonas media]MCV3289095.1 YjjW family glycine radical enzyme activase [Aeromonas media]QHQ50065.1 YjjW family glycine radical enzyme activase [Aeromonas media]QJT32012.1 YjjW family glycine radical enzyme activase [Aeromonas media]QJT33517.1 YjjW family glycine radical enzyme activase [Aeromonas media]
MTTEDDKGRRTATVSRWLPFSCVDGPGNRLVLFLQGCNFRCPGCHNPHTIGLCDHCGDCVPGCPSGALTLVEGRPGESRVRWQASLCTHCDRCLDACPRSASPKTHQMSVAEVLALLRRYGPLLTGITVSGGEATTQLPFVTDLFTAIKAAPDLTHLSCLLDSNGSLGEAGWQRLLPVLDGAMIDLKGWRDSVHHALTGQGRERVLASLQLLARVGKLAELRLLHVPGRTDFIDADGKLEAGLVSFLQSLGPVPIRLNGFRHHGVHGEALAWQEAAMDELDGLSNALKVKGFGPISLPPL